MERKQESGTSGHALSIQSLLSSTIDNNDDQIVPNKLASYIKFAHEVLDGVQPIDSRTSAVGKAKFRALQPIGRFGNVEGRKSACIYFSFSASQIFYKWNQTPTDPTRALPPN